MVRLQKLFQLHQSLLWQRFSAFWGLLQFLSGLSRSFLSVYILGTKRGTIAVILYLLIGAVGVPVFSGFAGGFGKIAGPTGGYLLGYIFAALIAGWFIHRFNDNVVIQFLGMLLGLIVLYAFGTAWLSISAGMDIKAAIAAGVFPFVVFDIAKIIIAILLGRTIKRRVPSLSQV